MAPHRRPRGRDLTGDGSRVAEPPSAERVAAVRRALLDWYRRHGRRLPWRSDRAPYRVVVSEFMLQQTQVDRVIPLFEAFVARFPSFAALADASLADVVRAWKGLGYNSRAVRLHRLARIVRDEHGGELPRDADALRALPGIGPYTVAAIRAFAFDESDLAVDTNVRRVVHRVLFGLEHPPRATARELDRAGGALVPPGAGNVWNSALMDLGATLCTARAPKCLLCPLLAACAAAPIDPAALAARRSAVAPTMAPPPRFEQSTRFARGRIIDRLRALAPGETISLLDLHADLSTAIDGRDAQSLDRIVGQLEDEGIVRRGQSGVALAE